MKKNQGEKWKLNAVLEKENTRWKIRLKTRVLLAIKMECVFSKRNLLGLSALLVPQVLQKSNFNPSIIFSLKLVPKHLIRSTYCPWHQFLTGFLPFCATLESF
jgi:hypothetical protein